MVSGHNVSWPICTVQRAIPGTSKLCVVPRIKQMIVMIFMLGFQWLKDGVYYAVIWAIYTVS